MKTTLLIMAAGIGSRYGAGIKQLAKVGPTGEIIMEYSIHDAIKAGFNKIVFIIRKDIEKEFREVIGDRIEKICANAGVEVQYTFQCMENVPQGVKVPADRTKPWGTGHAVLAAKYLINEPFAVINADDYYGKESFAKIHDFLVKDITATDFCMAGFVLKNTLSDNGGVTRGVCKVDHNGYLTDVDETRDIVKVGATAQSKGIILDMESLVSMNMWGLSPQFMDMLEDGFKQFFANIGEDDIKTEYLLPIYIDQLLKQGRVSVKVLPTNDEWFGVTYLEDKDYVVSRFAQLIDAGEYNPNLFSDL